MNERQFDKAMDRIENDDDLTPKEKQDAIRELERDYGEAVQEEMYQNEREDLNRKYGR
ncbi:MAG: hypothetical protein IMZ53_14960 [Thermoplasmata archaeon]|nr:hypothetical protein [Thermoplasmata archaeon]